MDRAVARQASWLAQNSMKVVDPAIALFVRVMQAAGLDIIPPGGISDAQLICFIMYLEGTTQANGKPYALSTIKTYVAMGPRQLQLRARPDIPWIATDQRPVVAAHLTGVARTRREQPVQKQPITPDILRAIYINMGGTLAIYADHTKLVNWTLMVLAFWTFLRKSNLVVTTEAAAATDRHALRRRDVNWDLDPSGHKTRAWLHVHLEKTEQYNVRGPRSIPLPRLPEDSGQSFLDPAAWLDRMTSCVKLAHDAFLFAYPARGGQSSEMGHPVTHSQFERVLRGHLLGLHLITGPVNAFTGHSFRRGGATFAFNNGVPPELIQLLGNWKSDAYKLYAVASDSTKITTVKAIADALALQYREYAL